MREPYWTLLVPLIDSDHILAYNNRGVAYKKILNPDYDKAISDFTRAIDLAPDYVEAYNNRGEAYMTKPDPDYDKAIQDFDRALELDPSHIASLNNRAMSRMLIDRVLTLTQAILDHNRAISGYTQALKNDPDLAVAHHNSGIERISHIALPILKRLAKTLMQGVEIKS